MTHPKYPLDGYEEQQQLLEVLSKDTVNLLVKVVESQDEGAMRSAIRVIFATIEAKIWVMKQEYLGFYSNECSPSELAHLTEQTEQLRDNGQLKPTKIILPIEKNLRFAFAQWEKWNGGTYQVDFKGADWQNFQTAVEVRNRLTHPKKPDDLKITQPDFKAATDALKWFDENSRRLFMAVISYEATKSGLTPTPYAPRSTT